MKALFVLFILAIKYIIINLQGTTENEECEFDTPLFNLQTSACTFEKSNEATHKIANKIVKKQWMNRINQIGINENWYMGFDISSNGDLIIQSIRYIGDTLIKERHFYAIKANGRNFFYNNEKSELINQIVMTIIKNIL